jgi:hypothetical protein
MIKAGVYVPFIPDVNLAFSAGAVSPAGSIYFEAAGS